MLKVDLTRNETSRNSVSAKLELLVQKCGTMSELQMKQEFLRIINDEHTVISKEKRNEYSETLKKLNGKMVVRYITDVYLNGAKLGMSKLKKK